MAILAKKFECFTGGLLDGNKSSCVGRVAEITEDDRVLVSYSGCNRDTVAARFVQPTGSGQPACFEVGDSVLLVFDDADPNLPIIVGALHNRMTSRKPFDQGIPRDLTVDGRRVVIEGKEEVVLKCGRASVTLRADGRLQIKGEHVVSRAAATNALRGGTVRIN